LTDHARLPRRADLQPPSRTIPHAWATEQGLTLMKSKGITIWEQHVEKMVLGLAFVAFAYFAATQFLGNPNAATINNQSVPPSEIDRLLEEKAKAINVKLSDDARPTIELPQVKPIADQMLAALTDPISPVDALALPQYYLVPQGKGLDILEPKAYHVPELDAPAPTRPKQYHDALTEEVVSAYPDELRDKFPPGQPYDLAYVTHFGEVDLAQLREELRKFDADHAQIPSTWYGGKPLFIDLVVERGEVVGDEITNVVILPPLPGQYSFRDSMKEQLSVDDRNVMLEELLKPEVQNAVIQPEFLATRRGSWQPLTIGELDEVEEVAVVDEDENELEQLDRRIRRAQQERDRIDTQLKEIGGPLEDTGSTPDDEPAMPRGGGGGAGPSKGGGGGSLSNTGGDALGADKERTRKQRIALTRKLKQLDERLARYQQEREVKHGAMLVEEVEDTGPADRIMVWGHDINVEPGKTYRYRMTIKVLNPFFARRLNLKPEQQSLADQVTLESPPSEWSDPITVSPPVRVFLTRASAASQGPDLGRGTTFGSATFQVFRFHDGLTWLQEFIVEPGDRVGSTKRVKLTGAQGAVKEESINFSTNWVVVDIIQDAEAPKAGALPSQQGMEARVVLMDMQTGEITEMRDPRDDKNSALRQELLDEVEMSEDAAFSS
jgi:hypothetical protein